MIGGDDPKVLTEFGAVVLSLASERGITEQSALARMLRNDKNESVSPQRLSPWLRGVNAPPNWLPRELSRVLNLSEDEEIRLAMAFAYGADRKLVSTI